MRRASTFDSPKRMAICPRSASSMQPSGCLLGSELTFVNRVKCAVMTQFEVARAPARLGGSCRCEAIPQSGMLRQAESPEIRGKGDDKGYLSLGRGWGDLSTFRMQDRSSSESSVISIPSPTTTLQDRTALGGSSGRLATVNATRQYWHS